MVLFPPLVRPWAFQVWTWCYNTAPYWKTLRGSFKGTSRKKRKTKQMTGTSISYYIWHFKSIVWWMVQAPEMQKSRKIVQYILLFLSLFSFELMSQLFCSFELNRGNFPPLTYFEKMDLTPSFVNVFLF